jgi:hypothetical protein
MEVGTGSDPDDTSNSYRHPVTMFICRLSGAVALSSTLPGSSSLLISEAISSVFHEHVSTRRARHVERMGR